MQWREWLLNLAYGVFLLIILEIIVITAFHGPGAWGSDA
jgi:hypothetical protein